MPAPGLHFRAWLALALSSACVGDAWAWPKVPLPEGSKGEMVSEHMKYNGLDMRASKFSSPMKPAQVVDFYARLWPDEHVVDKIGEKTVVGHADGVHYVTVELVAAGGGSDGTIGIVELPKSGKPPTLGKGIYKPVATEVVSDITYLDTPGETRTVVLRNKLSPYMNYQHYNQQLGPQGWRSTVTGTCKPASRECVVSFERGKGDRMAMTLNRQQDTGTGTVLVLNIE